MTNGPYRGDTTPSVILLLSAKPVQYPRGLCKSHRNYIYIIVKRCRHQHSLPAPDKTRGVVYVENRFILTEIYGYLRPPAGIFADSKAQTHNAYTRETLGKGKTREDKRGDIKIRVH
ncbi:hypothetical protein RRG08_055456 [Elysia crispata]|uniref:Uncharacterized protein n=1 Tax=Elysia crispata TaxID=231223 RepID=A0AAE1A916_9GAST|nr:hypothetical protein RRG08_055456 [Elysia crispata]